MPRRSFGRPGPRVHAGGQQLGRAEPMRAALLLPLLAAAAAGLSLQPARMRHLGVCPNQLNPNLWVDAQSTCERECQADQVSEGLHGGCGHGWDGFGCCWGCTQLLGKTRVVLWGWGVPRGCWFPVHRDGWSQRQRLQPMDAVPRVLSPSATSPCPARAVPWGCSQALQQAKLRLIAPLCPPQPLSMSKTSPIHPQDAPSWLWGRR